MTSPSDVAKFHAEYDIHVDDRVRLFRAIATVIAPSSRVLYPGSYVDIGPSVWFDDVTYVDMDKRAARFFAETTSVTELVMAKRHAAGAAPAPVAVAFHHLDYRDALPIEPGSIGLLASLYAGLVSEHCTELLSTGGHLLVNPSHGDAAMASIDQRYELAGVVIARDGDYRVDTKNLNEYLQPKKAQTLSAESIRQSGRGIAYTRSPFAYLFSKVG
ncbi:MAG: hypothetical protein R2706_20925 [Acidimicrobiales bacterium]